MITTTFAKKNKKISFFMVIVEISDIYAIISIIFVC